MGRNGPAPGRSLLADETTCPECGEVSTPSRTMHTEVCSRGEAARQERGERKVEVDGRESILHRGKTIALVELSTPALVHVLAEIDEDVARKEKSAKKATDALKAAKLNRDDAMRRLCERDRAEHGQQPLPMANLQAEP